MDRAPVLETTRLELRPYREADIAELIPLIGAREVAATTLRIPHPYTEDDARKFLLMAQQPDKLWLAVTLRNNGRQIGGVGLRIDEPHQNAELGYWLGVDYWGKGHATEASRELVRYGFRALGLHRIYASHFQGNTASASILKKLGMRHEGCQRQHIHKFGKFLDSELYGLLRQEWEVRERGNRE